MPVRLHMALYNTYHAQKNRLRPGMTDIGLSPGQPKILNYLSRRNNCMQKDIAEALDIEPATVSRILNNMVEAGLVRRSPPAERKRAESISVTDKGREAYAKWLRLCAEMEAAAMQGFTRAEQDRFIEYLSRMYHNLSGKVLE
ncbi:MAG TPA: MarR family transcriptional regulator [Feifaniaceae bacterium]|nr:MarR family transcriptional regulator [Feifaniaceae bacterium]